MFKWCGQSKLVDFVHTAATRLGEALHGQSDYQVGSVVPVVTFAVKMSTNELKHPQSEIYALYNTDFSAFFLML